MRFKKKLLSLLLVFSMVLSFVPTAFAAGAEDVENPPVQTEETNLPEGGEETKDETVPPAEGEGGTPAEPADNANDVVVEPEPWVYEPAPVPYLAFAALADEEAEDSDSIKVTVKANLKDGTEKPVPDATVELKVDGKVRGEPVKTDAKGEAHISVEGLSVDERSVATIAARKVVASDDAMDGTRRNAMLEQFKDPRYQLELHSEWIDQDGNWRGEEIPLSGSNAVDIAFAIDATGSMGDEINNVKDNLVAFTSSLVTEGLDLRFSILEYRDITEGEDTVVHMVEGSPWMKDVDTVGSELAKIHVSGGGDLEETPIDALGYAVQKLDWRTGAHRFIFVLTDAGYKEGNGSNTYGYSTMDAVTNDLQSQNIVTSVITTARDKETYKNLYGTTRGIYANIDNKESFLNEMMLLADESIVRNAKGDVTLTLDEPRMLVNMSVSYLTDDAKSGSEAYKTSIQKMMNEYGHRMAETTDGHVMLNEVLLVPVTNRVEFYDTTKPASMADIRIETDAYESTRVHSNAHVGGFYLDGIYRESSGRGSYNWLPDALKELDTGRSSFYRIQMSGIEGAGWENSLIDQTYAYTTTVMHETGHYLFGFRDEYMNGEGKTWRDLGYRPNGGMLYGLMDNQHDDIEMSKQSIEYPDGYSLAASATTNQVAVNKVSCEEQMIKLLTEGKYLYGTLDTGNYKINYTMPEAGKDRLTTVYPETDLVKFETAGAASRAVARTDIAAGDSLGVSWTVGSIQFTSPVAGTVELVTKNGKTYTDTVSAGGTVTLSVDANDLAEVKLISGGKYNVFYIDRANNSSYVYGSPTGSVVAYTQGGGACTFITDGYTDKYAHDGLVAVNEATYINGDPGSGKIYSVANYMDNIDYSTLSWYKYDGTTYTLVASTYEMDVEEDMNVGVLGNLSGEGVYVLMAKQATESGSAPVITSANPSTEKDGVVTFTITGDGDYFDVYYSANGDFNPETTMVKRFAKADTYTLNLVEHGRAVYAKVQGISEAGGRTPMSAITTLVGGTADTDGDGLPNWYCNKYQLWRKSSIKPGDLLTSGGYTYKELYDLNPDRDPRQPTGRPSKPTTGTTTTSNAFVYIPNVTGGTVVPSELNPSWGSQVILYAHPKAGYELTSLTVTDVRGWAVATREISAGSYVFTMPDVRVNVNAVFSPIDGEEAPDTTVSVPAAGIGYGSYADIVYPMAPMAYSDVNTSDWFYSSVEYVYKRRMMSGKTDSAFDPASPAERHVTWTALARMSGRDTTGGATEYERGQIWAMNKGITDGSNPTGSLTREQLMTMLWRFKGSPVTPNDTLTGYADNAKVSTWARDAVNWAVANGLLNGSYGNLNPQGETTRAETAAILMRFHQNIR